MNPMIRAAAAAAIALPLAAPAAASSLAPISAVSQQPHLGGVKSAGPKDTLLRIHAKHQAKTAHFAFPYALALDAAGDLYVANIDSHSVAVVTPQYKIVSSAITTGSATPVSLATDVSGDVYVGNINGSTGYIGKYSPSLSQIGTITANAAAPFGIAVDQAQDIFIIADTALAVDDPYGNSISSNIFSIGPQLFSVAIGAPNVFTFYSGTSAFGNVSVALRGLTLQYLDGPLPPAEPIGAACAATSNTCWLGDSQNDTLTQATLPGSSFSIGLPYTPAGIAVDQLRNRLYVADPVNNKIEIYNATSLSFEKFLT